LFILFSFCAPKKKIEIAPQVVEYRTKEKEADILLKKGSYACLKEAFQIYHDLLSEPQTQEQTKEKLIKTGLLLTLREKELGIQKNKYLDQPSDLIKGSPSLSEFSLYLEVVNSILKENKGATQDEKAAFCNEAEEKNLENKIKKIENSDFSEERKARLIKKKRIQLKKTVLTKATFFYNAAAGYLKKRQKN